ncbi:TPA: hypothetical protein R9Y59_001671 [Stenotrophomonas maltophilia]|uniref:Uncharacterized protein n=2 Tax=Stenotrophomonas maltophilia TaxID=40324 RepID=A0AAI9CDM9_STEMA|nr:hypothetical protein [Stenotrophomonas maltophilia]EKT4442749.1 hypothetical protein [Stenotrophomonas maltophilia]NNH49438.1 hypothetical protein [Stenotrophomonas maltophilia]HDS1084638.1 hypothetical protein [Stenotrophomonas maltophilia]HDS1303952.1 hypothetical protein [Stenotrophomonas maltophilia]HDS1820970.1 hypothetical protein [Stenotrophomonas maltophilia]
MKMQFTNRCFAALKKSLSNWALVPQRPGFSRKYAILMVVIAIAACVVDWYSPNEYFWFQRSGALLVLAGVSLQYSKLTSSWKQRLDPAYFGKTTEERIRDGSGISMLAEAEALDQTRKLVAELHQIVAEPDLRDFFSVAFAIVGTLVWALGDVPFRSS